MSYRAQQAPDEAVRQLPVVNGASEDVPAFALMHVTGVDADGALLVDMPDADGQTDVLVNGPVPIPPGAHGQGHSASPAAVLYDDADGAPAAGETWGAAAGSWKARKGKAGALVVGGTDAAARLTNVLHLWGLAPSGLTPHQLLDSTHHTDTMTAGPAQGRLILGSGIGPVWTVLDAPGTTGPQLTVTDGLNKTVAWASPNLLSASHGDTLTGSPLKGSLIVGDGNTPHKWVALPVGINGQVLTSDSGSAVGVNWSAGTPGPTGPTGATGPAGATGAAGAPGSVWREGSGAPSSGLGVDGDFYLDGATGDVYQKASGAYSVVANIRGPSGGSATLADGNYGDVTVSGGGTVIDINAGAVGGLEIASDAVSNAKLANMPANTLKGNNTAGSTDPLDLTVAQVLTLLGVSGTNTGDQLVFKTISVSGQSDVVADATADTLTLVAGTGVTITTNASTDTITIAASGGSGTVTSFSAGNLSPLFTTSTATATTTPALTFTLSTQSANVVFAGPSSGAAAAPTFRALVEADTTLADVTTNNVTSTKHGLAPKSPADATKFLNGAATPAYALVKGSDLSMSDVTTNNVSTTAHGFAPKAPNDATKYLDGTGAYSVPPGSGDNVIVLRDVKSSGVAGGTFTAGAWRTRDVNNEQHDGPNCCTVSGNQFTLTAGTYEIDARAPAFYVNSHQAVLRNVTDGVETLPGTSEYSGVGTAYSVTPSVIRGVFAIAATKTFEVQHQCASTNTTFGFGQPASFAGGGEVYTTIVLRKIA